MTNSKNTAGIILFSILLTTTGRAEEPDKDSDGVPDATDVCPEKAGNSTEILGCPPAEKMEMSGDEPDTHSEPDVDSDKDGVLNTEDECPKVAGVASSKGCPEDRDHDETPDAQDKCPDEPDNSDRWVSNGCPVGLIDVRGVERADLLIFTLVFDQQPPAPEEDRWEVSRDRRSQKIGFKFKWVVNKMENPKPGFGESVVLRYEMRGDDLVVVISSTEERQYTSRVISNEFSVRIYPEGRGPEEPPAVAAVPPPPASSPPPPPAAIPTEVASADKPIDTDDNDDGVTDNEEENTDEVIPAEGEGEGEGEVLAQADKPAPPPPPPPAPTPAPPKAEEPQVQPPAAPPPPASTTTVEVEPPPPPPPPSPPAPEGPAEKPPVVVPPPAPPVEEVHPGPAKLVGGEAPRGEEAVNEAERLARGVREGCGDTSWPLRGATLRGAGVSWRDDWEALLDEAVGRMSRCGKDYRLEVCGVEDVKSYNSKDVDVKLAGGREAVGAARAYGRRMMVFHHLQNKLGQQYADQLGFCEDRVVQVEGERGADVLFRYSPRPAAEVAAIERVVREVIQRENLGKPGPEGPQGPPGPITVGHPGPPGEGLFSVLQIGVNTQVKDLDWLLLSLAQLRLGVGDLLFLQMELGGAQWRLTGGLGAGIRYELVDEWLAASAVTFLRARERQWSDFETGLALGIEVDLWDVVLEARGELKGLKGNGNVLHKTWAPFVPAATLGGFAGWKF